MAADSEVVSTRTGTGMPGGEFLSTLSNLSVVRQVGLMVGLAASVAIGLAVVLWSQQPDYRPLYGNLEDFDSAQVLQALQQQNIQYRIEPNSGTVLVPADQIAEARMFLSTQGINSHQIMGMELLDQEQGLGSSQFMENIRYRRGLEGELARTISSLYNVKSARVHLAIPKRSVFVRDSRSPSASVFLELFGARALMPQQVRAIMNLVASSVPEMKTDQVTVVNQKGDLLSLIDESQNAELKMANKQLEYARKLESSISRRVHNILGPVLGANNYQAEVSADIDFNAIEQTSERFNPDAPALRSEQTLNEQSDQGTLNGGIPGALTNQPPQTATAPEVAPAAAQGEAAASAAQDSRTQATRNYELDKTISHTRFQQGRVRRLSVAVVVNDATQLNAETGEMVRVPWTQSELERFTQLVKDAVGYDLARGDSVNVINSAFIEHPAEVFEEIPFWTEPWFWTIAKQVLGGLFVLVILFGFVRPLFKSMSAAGTVSRDPLAHLEDDDLGLSDELGDDKVSLSGSSGMLLPGPHEGYEQQLNAVKGLVADDPGRVAQVVKQWVIDDE